MFVIIFLCLVVPPAHVSGTPHHAGLDAGDDVACPERGALVYLNVESGVPGAQSVELSGLTGPLPALNGIDVGVLVDGRH